MTQPLPEPVLGVAWRALRQDDAEALHTLVRNSQRVDATPFISSLEEIRQQMTDPQDDLSADSVAGVLPDGTLAAYGTVHMRSLATRRRAAHQDGTVRPDLRRRGLGTAVMRWTEARARERLAGFADGLPRVLEAWSNQRWEGHRALFGAQGYRPIRYYDDMRRPLAEPIPEAALPTGLHFELWTPELDEAFRQAHNESFVDHWGSEPLSAEAWGHQFIGSPYFRPDLTHGVFEGVELVGYCMSYHSPDDTQVTGRAEGWLGQIGVRRAWRSRGVATSVMCHVMRAMSAAGLDYASLDVDSENPSGAVGLYTRLGFRTDERWVRWAKPA